MAFQLPGKRNVMSEINVTPLVDVMLVLLVIFMVTAPLMLNGIKITLPRTKESNPINLSSEQIILSFTRAGDLYIGEQKYLREEIITKIMQEFKSKKTDVVFLRADFGLNYGRVAALMSLLKSNGITKIALVTEMDKKSN
ncbi:MAG: biopolymer transporter ExbD [Bdellovibrio sp.]|nr:biopolymer transporter ExbD [Bdellovibrio sp.]